MRTRVVTITPKMAFEWMEKNARNRPVSLIHVERLAGEMKAGRWAETGEAIKFASNGTLIDGQHRLSACVLANKPFRSLVVEGIPADAFNKLDQGKRRNLADAFGRDRKKNANNLAAACYVLWMLERKTSTRDHMSIDEGFAVLKRHPTVEEHVSRACGFHRAVCPMSLSIAGGYMTWTSESWGDQAIRFWNRVCTGEDVPPKSPESLLIRTLRGSANQILTYAATNAYCAKAFNAAIGNRKLTKLSFDPAKEGYTEFLR